MPKPLTLHPVAALFPAMPAAEYAALVKDIRERGVRVPILVRKGQILDGRHRYRACQELGVPCPMVQWNGRDAWFEVQSQNLVRRHLAKDQVYAIRKLAAERFPELAAPIEATKAEAKQRKAQAKGQPRGHKALLRSRDRQRESADIIGAELGVSGATVKRVDRLAREAPEFIPRVAAGEISVKAALREALLKKHGNPATRHTNTRSAFQVDSALQRLEHVIRAEWTQWSCLHRPQFLYRLRQLLLELIREHQAAIDPRGTTGSRTLAPPDQRPTVSSDLGADTPFDSAIHRHSGQPRPLGVARRKDYEMMEEACHEGERSVAHTLIPQP